MQQGHYAPQADYTQVGMVGEAGAWHPTLVPGPMFEGDFQMSRSVYIGGVGLHATTKDLCRLGNTCGALERVKLISHKRCAFLNFVQEDAAIQFFEAAQSNGSLRQRLRSLCDTELCINWAKSAARRKYTGGQGGRCLLVHNIPRSMNDEELYRQFWQLASMSLGDSLVSVELIADLNSPKQELKVRVECTDQPGAYRFAQSLQTTPLLGELRLVTFVEDALTPLHLLPEDTGVAPSLNPQPVGGGGHKPSSRMPQRQTAQLPTPSETNAAVDEAPATRSAHTPVKFGPHTPLTLGDNERRINISGLDEKMRTLEMICPCLSAFGVLQKIEIDAKCVGAVYLSATAASACLSQIQQKGHLELEKEMPAVTCTAESVEVEPISEAITLAYKEQSATRCVFFGSIPPHFSDAQLTKLCAPLCNNTFESILILRERKIAFVNTANIEHGMAIVESCQTLAIPGVDQFKVNFAREPLARLLHPETQGRAQKKDHYNILSASARTASSHSTVPRGGTASGKHRNEPPTMSRPNVGRYVGPRAGPPHQGQYPNVQYGDTFAQYPRMVQQNMYQQQTMAMHPQMMDMAQQTMQAQLQSQAINQTMPHMQQAMPMPPQMMGLPHGYTVPPGMSTTVEQQRMWLQVQAQAAMMSSPQHASPSVPLPTSQDSPKQPQQASGPITDED